MSPVLQSRNVTGWRCRSAAKLAVTSDIGGQVGCAGRALGGMVPFEFRRPARRFPTRFDVAVLGARGRNSDGGQRLVLYLLDIGQYVAQTFVLGNFRMGHALILVEDPMGQHQTFVANLKVPIAELIDVHIFANQAAGDIVDLQDHPFAVIGKGQVVAHISLIAQTKNLAQPINFNVQGKMPIFGSGRGLGKQGIEPFHEARKERIARIHVRDARQTQFLDEAVLQRAIGAFDPTSDLSKMGAWLELAQRISMFSSAKARPNCVMPDRGGFGAGILNTECLSL